MDTCIAACLACHRACLEGAMACLKKGGRHAEADHIRLLLDCAQLCAVASDFMIRGSSVHMKLCALCAEICDACAASCDALGSDAQMAACAAACRRCAEACRAMGCH